MKNALSCVVVAGLASLAMLQGCCSGSADGDCGTCADTARGLAHTDSECAPIDAGGDGAAGSSSGGSSGSGGSGGTSGSAGSSGSAGASSGGASGSGGAAGAGASAGSGGK